MGRPPLGERALTPAEKMRRYRERKFGNKPPVTKQGYAAAQARIAGLEREAAQLRAQIAQHKARIAELEREKAQRDAEPVLDASPAARTATGNGPNTQIDKFIRHLGNANQTEAAMAARKLVGILTASESDRHALADLWEKHRKEQARQRPPKPVPADWPGVERAIKTYTEGKTKVTINKTMHYAYTQVPNLEGQDGIATLRFVLGCLGRLGFKSISRSGETYGRATP
jgi:hypothetical protein